MLNIFSLFTILVYQLVSIYTISVNDNTGNAINFAAFTGKKILLVNTASNSTNAGQYAQLEQLYQLHKDSLVIIAFPSNDFGNEPGTIDSINSWVHTNYNIHYLLAEKTIVSGSEKSYLYNWLSDINANGMMNSSVSHDFYKYLINSEGKLIGIFNEEVDPLDSKIQEAITNWI